MHLGTNLVCEISRCYGQTRGPFPCGHTVIVGFLPETVSTHHCQHQTQIHCLTQVSNKKLILCADTGTTWQLPRTKGTHAAISGLILRHRPSSRAAGAWGSSSKARCAGEEGEAALKQLMRKTRLYPSGLVHPSISPADLRMQKVLNQQQPFPKGTRICTALYRCHSISP